MNFIEYWCINIISLEKKCLKQDTLSLEYSKEEFFSHQLKSPKGMDFPKGDKYILGKKQIDIAIKTLDQERKALLKARDQGGVVAVEANGVLITAYRFDSFNRKLAQS